MSKATKTKERDAEDTLFETPPQPKPQLPARTDRARTREPAPAVEARVVPMTDPMQIMDVIARLAADPAVNPEKLDRLLSLQERLMDRSAMMAFDAAFLKLQSALVKLIIEKNGTIEVRKKNTATGRRDGALQQSTGYPKYETVVPVILPVLHRHGFTLTHRTERTAEGRLKVTAVLTGYGHTNDKCWLEFEADTTGSKNNAQAWVSVQSYGRRATTFSVLNLVARGEDDDGKKAGLPVVVGEPITPDQVISLRDFAEAAGCKMERLVDHLSKTRPKGHPELKLIDDLPANRFDAAIDALRSYEANKKAAQTQQGGSK